MTRRPDALGSWSGPLDCENQDIIHSQCQEQAGMYVSILFRYMFCVKWYLHVT